MARRTCQVDAATATGPVVVTVAAFDYDSTNHLVKATDPRTGLSVGYGYDLAADGSGSGRLRSLTPPGGAAAWTLTYAASGSTALAPYRLSQATLTPTGGASTPKALTSTVVYDLKLGGSVAGLPKLTADEVAGWGQTTSPPTDLTAVFDPDTVPVNLGAVTAAEWQGAQLSALDVNGRTVNTAHYGGTLAPDGTTTSAAWRIATTEYDTAGRGNVVRTLSAGNRERALAVSQGSYPSPAAAQLAQARMLDTVNVYSSDGLDLLRSYGPAHPVTTRTATGTATAGVLVRSRTVTAFDTGSETGHPQPLTRSLHLPVRRTTDAISDTYTPAGGTVTSTTSDVLAGPDGPGLLAAADVPARTTTWDYLDANAWTFGVATRTTTTPDTSTSLLTMTRVDGHGRPVSRTLPAAQGIETTTSTATTAATTLTSYYTAGAVSGGDPACVNAAYAGWVCKTTPAAPPAPAGSGAGGATFAVPPSWVSRYDVYGHPLRTVETAPDGSLTRTADTTYDTAGRPVAATVTQTGSAAGSAAEATAALGESDTAYDSAGRIAAVSTPGGTAAAGTGPVVHGYDAYGRQISYTDGSGAVTATSYDDAGRLSTVTTAHGKRTLTYDNTVERGRPVALQDSAAATTDSFTAGYDPDGVLRRQSYPGGLTALTVTDADGSPASLTYRPPGPDANTPGPAWLRSTSTYTAFGQVDTAGTEAATGTAGQAPLTSTYRYDGTGRLTTATDTPTGSTDPAAPCTRAWTYDRNSNRLSQTQTGPAGTCSSAVPAADSYSYDTADRLLPAAAGATGTASATAPRCATTTSAAPGCSRHRHHRRRREPHDRLLPQRPGRQPEPEHHRRDPHQHLHPGPHLAAQPTHRHPHQPPTRQPTPRRHHHQPLHRRQRQPRLDRRPDRHLDPQHHRVHRPGRNRAQQRPRHHHRPHPATAQPARRHPGHRRRHRHHPHPTHPHPDHRIRATPHPPRPRHPAARLRLPRHPPTRRQHPRRPHPHGRPPLHPHPRPLPPVDPIAGRQRQPLRLLHRRPHQHAPTSTGA